MEKFMKRIIEHKFLYFIILISILFIVFYFICGVKITTQVYISNNTAYPTEIIKNQTKYTQYFKCNIDDLNEIGIKFSTYMKNNKNGYIRINLYDENDLLIKSSEIKVENIKDNQFVYMGFDKIKDSINKKYKVEFFYEKYNEDITISYWETQADEENYLKVNDDKTNSSIQLILTGEKNDYTVLYYPIIAILICLIVFTII